MLLNTETIRPDVAAWLAEVRAFQEQIIADRGCFPDSTQDIAEDRVRDD